jgi:hypothetical protein
MAVRESPGVTKLQGRGEHPLPPNDFVVPVVHVHLPESAVKLGFYGGLGAAVALGAVDWPLAVLVGAGVAIARHRRA